MKKRRPRQLHLRFHPRGGARRKAGRKPKNGIEAGVSHLARERFERTLPVHVTLRMAAHVYNLRSQRCFSVIGRAFAAAAERFGVRIVQFAVLGNHVHLVVEATSNDALAKAMQGFSIRVAKGLNRVMNRSGRVLGDRYHGHVMRNPTEVRTTLRYVRNNFRTHEARAGRILPAGYVDRYSSAFGGVPLPMPTIWLLREGWKRAPPPPG